MLSILLNLVEIDHKCSSSQVPEPVGWALMPVAPIGELFGWLFALELPNSQAGFKITGKLSVSVLPDDVILPCTF